MNEINNEPLGAKCSRLNRGKVEISPWCDLLILYMPVGPSLHRKYYHYTCIFLQHLISQRTIIIFCSLLASRGSTSVKTFLLLTREPLTSA